MNLSSRPYGLTRRQVLCKIGGGFGALGLASILADAGLLAAETTTVPVRASNPLAPKPPHFPPRAKRVIFLFMNGGPSHVDTFDPKPMLEKYQGKPLPSTMVKTGRKTGGNLLPSPFKAKPFGQSGIMVTELYPEVGGCIDDICVLRSVYTDNPNHEPGLLLMNSGNMQPIRPSMGSWLTFALGSDNQNLPGFIVLCPGKPVVGPQLWSNSFLPGIYQGTHINNQTVDPKAIIRDVRSRYLSPPAQRAQLDLLQQMNQLHLEQRARDEQLEARIASLEIAFRMQSEAQEAFDISTESAAVRALYGDGEFANACLIARRLAERGVRMTLLKDLKSRGLLNDTLVIWGGEFGRTPTSQGATGRDHHSLGFSMWLAGGGVKGGTVYGATDEFGFQAVENRMHVHDLHATVLHLMGLDHERLTYRYSGRDFRLTDVHGKVVKDIMV